jgi:hypothetical protein
MKKFSLILKAVCALSLTFVMIGSALATTTETTTTPAVNAGITLAVSEVSGKVQVDWLVANPENLTNGFKVLVSETNAAPQYPQDGTAYHYYSDNTLRTDTFTDLTAGKTYHFRIGQYNTDGTCTYYSEVKTLTLSGTAPTTDTTTAADAGLKLTALHTSSGILLSWTVTTPENLVGGFKVLASSTNLSPEYPQDGTAYHYYSDNALRADTFTDLAVGKTYYFRVCQYNGNGTCLYYSNTVSMEIIGTEAVPTLYETSTAEPSATTFFNDTEDHWASPYALKLKENCGIKGYTDSEGNLLYEFRPDAKITRAELAKMLVQCTGEEKTGLENNFSDLDTEAWFANAVLTAQYKGWVDGYPDGTFKPLRNVNRAEALKMIMLIKYTSFQAQGEIVFDDLDPGAWYIDYIIMATNNNIVSGYSDGTFRPAADITRGEAAKIIVNVKGL